MCLDSLVLADFSDAKKAVLANDLVKNLGVSHEQVRRSLAGLIQSLTRSLNPTLNIQPLTLRLVPNPLPLLLVPNPLTLFLVANPKFDAASTRDIYSRLARCFQRTTLTLGNQNQPLNDPRSRF